MTPTMTLGRGSYDPFTQELYYRLTSYDGPSLILGMLFDS